MQGQTKIAVGIGTVLIGVGAWYLAGHGKPAHTPTAANTTVADETAANETAAPAEPTGDEMAPVQPVAAQPPVPETSGIASPAPRHIEDTGLTRESETARPEPFVAHEPASLTDVTGPRSGLSSIAPQAAELPASDVGSAAMPVVGDMPPNVDNGKPAAASLTESNKATTKPAATVTVKPTRVDAAPVSTFTTTRPAVATATRTHTVAKGETLSSISVKYFGSVKHVNLLLKANPGKDPKKLYVGAKLNIPPAPADATPATTVTETAAPKTGKTPAATVKVTTADKVASKSVKEIVPPPPADRSYTVQPGEDWYSLAKRFLGDSNDYPELYELNKERVGGDPHLLRAGTVIEIPKDAKVPPSKPAAK